VRTGSAGAATHSAVQAESKSERELVVAKKKRLDALAVEAGALIAEMERLRDEVLRAGGHDAEVEVATAKTSALIERFQQAQEQPEQVVSRVNAPTSPPAETPIPVPPLAASVPGEAGLYRLSKTAWNTKATVRLPKGYVSRRSFFRAVLPVGYVAYFKGQGARFDGVVVNDVVARTWEEWLEWAALSTGTRFNLDYRVARVTYWGVLPTPRTAAPAQ
jgi:hypothetical protein